jgi:hypothetical protein
MGTQQVRFFDLSVGCQHNSHHNITMRMYYTSLRKSHNRCRNQTMPTDSMPMHLPFNVSWSNVSLSDHVPFSLATAVPCREAASNKTMAPILMSNTTTTPTHYPHVNLMVPYLAMAAAFLAFMLYVVFSPFQYARVVVLVLNASKTPWIHPDTNCFCFSPCGSFVSLDLLILQDRQSAVHQTAVHICSTVVQRNKEMQ